MGQGRRLHAGADWVGPRSSARWPGRRWCSSRSSLTSPHFWALAMRFRDDYARAGGAMLPVVATPAVVASHRRLHLADRGHLGGGRRGHPWAGVAPVAGGAWSPPRRIGCLGRGCCAGWSRRRSGCSTCRTRTSRCSSSPWPSTRWSADVTRTPTRTTPRVALATSWRAGRRRGRAAAAGRLRRRRAGRRTGGCGTTPRSTGGRTTWS